MRARKEEKEREREGGREVGSPNNFKAEKIQDEVRMIFKSNSSSFYLFIYLWLR